MNGPTTAGLFGDNRCRLIRILRSKTLKSIRRIMPTMRKMNMETMIQLKEMKDDPAILAQPFS